MNAISDYNFYNNEMKKGIEDKLFFMNRIDIDIVVDYGCADGSLIEVMQEFHPQKEYLGYDFDPEMIKKAKIKNIPHAKFFSDFNELCDYLAVYKNKKSMVLCSSLIHEVYSYGNEESIKTFWNNIYSDKFNYVVIRDMAFSEKEVNKDTQSKWHNVERLRKHANPIHLSHFESIWGSVEKQENMVHFLLKYRYEKNWSREVEENYFPVSVEEHMAYIPDNFQLIHFEHYPLAFNQKTIKEDFNINLSTNTHIKMIIKRM